MLDTFFTQIKVRSRMESGPIGPYLSEIAALLHRNGYARSTIRRHLRAADRFGAWILKEGMSIVDINASIVDRYLEGLGRQFFPSRLGGTLPDKASGLRQMVEMLSQQGVLRPDAKEQPRCWHSWLRFNKNKMRSESPSNQLPEHLHSTRSAFYRTRHLERIRY